MSTILVHFAVESLCIVDTCSQNSFEFSLPPRESSKTLFPWTTCCNQMTDHNDSLFTSVLRLVGGLRGRRKTLLFLKTCLASRHTKVHVYVVLNS